MNPLPKTPHTDKSSAGNGYRQSLDALLKGDAPFITAETLKETLARLQPAIARICQKSVPEIAAILRSMTLSTDLPEIESAARKFRNECKHMIVLGAGGSCLSGRALCMLAQEGGPQLHFIDTIDPQAIAQLTARLPLEDTGVLAISKSGGTVETLALLSALLGLADEKNIKLASRTLAICRDDESPLRSLAATHGFATLEHDPDLCGRFSVFSAVGLLPAAIAGLNIRAIRDGANATLAALKQHSEETPSAPALGAASQWLMMMQQKSISTVMAYGEALSGIAWWHRQSWAESLGKSGLGSTAHASFGPSDQHSQLQLYLEGPKDKFFTLLIPATQGTGLAIPKGTLDFLDGHTLGDVMQAEAYATHDSLIAAKLPVRLIEIPETNEASLGALYAHWIFEIILVADLLGINAFDQPAVEESKRLARELLAGGA